MAILHHFEDFDYFVIQGYLDNLQKYNLIRLFMYPSAGFFFLSLTKKKGGKILRNFKTCH